jgi:hypothetical protein
VKKKKTVTPSKKQQKTRKNRILQNKMMVRQHRNRKNSETIKLASKKQDAASKK